MKESGNCPQSDNFSPKQERLLMPTPEQQKAAEVAFYVELIDIFDRQSKKEAGRHFSNRLIKRKQFKSKRVELRTALQDLYFSDGNKEFLDRFRKNLGGEAHILEDLLRDLSPIIDSAKQRTIHNAQNLSTREKRKIVNKSSKKISSFTAQERVRLFEVAGYSKEESERIRGKIKTSFKISVPLEVSKEALGIAGAFALERFINQTVGQMSIPESLFFGNLIYYLSIAPVAIANLRLLRSKGNSPNGIATYLYYAGDKILSSKPHFRNLLTFLGSYGFEPIKDPLWNLVALYPERGPDFFLGACLSVASVHIMQASVSEVVIRKNK